MYTPNHNVATLLHRMKLSPTVNLAMSFNRRCVLGLFLYVQSAASILVL